MRIGLSGFNCATGLGYQNRDLVDKLPVASWLVVEHPSKPGLELPEGVDATFAAMNGSDGDVGRWLESIDCLLFYEQPLVSSLPRMARDRKVAIVCIPNWEWLNPEAEWLNEVDCFICPNRYTFNLLSEWKRARNGRWKLEHVPAPVDTSRFRPTIRKRCESFLFVNGHGGCTPYFPGLFRHRKGSPRKGLDVVLRAARLVPEIPILIRSQVTLPADVPKNVTILPALYDNTELFTLGDVAIQPSYFEGTGLQMIETLASGMPLISTDAPPMNELPLLDAIRCELRVGKVAGSSVLVSFPDAKDLARLMEKHHGTDICESSLASRRHVETHHSWPAALDAMCGVLRQVSSV